MRQLTEKEKQRYYNLKAIIAGMEYRLRYDLFFSREHVKCLFNYINELTELMDKMLVVNEG